MTDILTQAKELSGESLSFEEWYYESRSMFLDLIAECEKWHKIAIEERARANFYSLLPEGGEDMWSEATEDVRRSRREQAERELEAMK